MVNEENRPPEIEEDQEEDRPPVPPLLRTRSNELITKRTKLTSDFSDVPDDFELPPGDAKRGAKYFKKYCMQCHSIYPDNRVVYAGQYITGPTLFNICGRASGQEEMFNPTNPYRVNNILWTDSALMNYMKNPRKMSGGPNQMNFEGIKNIGIRVDIIHYLYTLDWSNDMLVNPPPRPVGGIERMWNIITGKPKEESWHNITYEKSYQKTRKDDDTK